MRRAADLSSAEPLTDAGVLSFAQLTIQKGTKIRLKIVGTRVDATEIVRLRSSLFSRAGPCAAKVARDRTSNPEHCVLTNEPTCSSASGRSRRTTSARSAERTRIRRSRPAVRPRPSRSRFRPARRRRRRRRRHVVPTSARKFLLPQSPKPLARPQSARSLDTSPPRRRGSLQ